MNSSTSYLLKVYTLPLEDKLKEILSFFPHKQERLDLLVDLINSDLRDYKKYGTNISFHYCDNFYQLIVDAIDLGRLTLCFDDETDDDSEVVPGYFPNYINYTAIRSNGTDEVNFKFECEDRDELKDVALEIIKYLISEGKDLRSIPLLLNVFPDFSRHVLSLASS